MSVLNKKQEALLAKVVAATQGPEGFMYSDPDSKEHKALVSLQLIEVRNDMHDEAGNIATRATHDGVAAIEGESDNGDNNGSNNQQPKGNQEMTTAQTQAPAGTATFTKFAIAQVALPTAKRGGRTGSTYPFDQLEVGQSFFVPATEARPDPAKSLASTVTSANERYSEVIPGQTRVNRKGNTVPATKQIRLFAIRSVDDGKAWGHPGVKGAAVGRVELGSESDE
jgi:hypothetical protein